jgi:hypothetical protein
LVEVLCILIGSRTTIDRIGIDEQELGITGVEARSVAQRRLYRWHTQVWRHDRIYVDDGGIDKKHDEEEEVKRLDGGSLG